jgi:hypothetical protein
VWKSTDADGNGVQDFWVADIAGLYYMTGDGSRTEAIPPYWALADARPRGPCRLPWGRSIEAAPSLQPKFGYWLCVIPAYRKGGRLQQYDTGGGTNPDRYAYCAYPAFYRGTGSVTFVVTENGLVLKKDTGGQRVDVWDYDNSAGWRPLD